MAQQKRRPNTMVYGNLAYDLDTLASQRQLEEAARPERQSQPQQAPRHRTAAVPGSGCPPWSCVPWVRWQPWRWCWSWVTSS